MPGQENEYTNRGFKEYSNRTGGKQQFTAPYTPHQNGICEEVGKIIMDITRSLLVKTALPKRLWCKLARTAVFLKTRMPQSALGNNTPYYQMFRKNADLSFLQIIGSRTFVHVERQHKKLDQRAWEDISVGYKNDSPKYTIGNSASGKIISSRNVTSIEHVEINTPSSMVDDTEERAHEFRRS